MSCSGKEVQVKCKMQCELQFQISMLISPNIHQTNAWIRWFVKCSNCFCLCDDETDSDRYISLREVVSNLERNRCELSNDTFNQLKSK